MTQREQSNPAAPDTSGDVRPHSSNDATDLEPMTFSLLARFFFVPLLIIGTIVGGAVCVVLLFGGPATAPQRSLSELLQALEATSGQKSLGILLPKEKEHWQTALELSVRLKEKDKAPSPTDAELDDVADRVAAMIVDDLDVLARLDPADAQEQVDIRTRRLEFLLHALGRTERPAAVESLVAIVRGGREPVVQVAIQELAELRAVPGASAAVAPITALLDDTTSAETRLVASTSLSVLAPAGDREVLEALERMRTRSEGEVEWSAALALARLGSAAGASTLMDLLDRSFLESGDRYVVRDPKSGTVHRYPMPPGKVEQILIAAVDAASGLDHGGLWEMIERLSSDPSPAVRGKVAEVLKAHGRES